MTSDLALNELNSNENTFGDDFDNDLRHQSIHENNLININNNNNNINNNIEELNDNELSSTLLSPINSSSSQQLLSSPKNESKQTQNSFNNLIKNLNETQNRNQLINDLKENENNNKCNEISDNIINSNNLLLINLCQQNINNNKTVKRVHLDEKTLMSLNVNELRHYWTQQEMYINCIESQLKQFNRDKSDLISLRESEEKLKQQQLEANRRENVLVMRLTTKEQEMQEYLNQIQELKQSQVPSNAQLQSTLVDPAVNLMFEKMKKEVDSSRAKVEEMQSELNAWKFTPDSTTGKRLMAKCRLLYQENEELGKMIASGRIAKIEGELALQRNFSEEMKKSQSELDEFLLELDEDVEGMQNTIYYLQQQLKEAKEKLAKLENVQQNNCVLQNNTNLDTNVSNSMSSQQMTNMSTNERTFAMRAEVSDNVAEVAINGPNIDSSITDINDNNETLDSVNSNEDFYVQKSTNNDISSNSEREVNINNNNNYLSLVNNSNLNSNQFNNKRTSCFDDDIHIDDDYKQPFGKVAKLNDDSCNANSSGNSSKPTKQLINDDSQHSNDLMKTCSDSDLTSVQNNCIEINGQLNQ